MPSHRAYYATAEEARTAASTAVERLTALWQTATEDAGERAASTAPVIDVRMEGVSLAAAAPGVDAGSVAEVRITGPDGRQEIATISMPTEQSDVLLDKASGTITVDCTALPTATVTGRVAASIQATVTAACTLTGLVVQDRFSGKKYTCGASTPSAAGVVTVPVTEVDSADLGDVTYGSVVEFLAPVVEVNPIARVNALIGFGVNPGDELTDESGRLYEVSLSASHGGGTGLSGNAELTITLRRDTSDGLDELPNLAVDDELTFSAAHTGAKRTVTVSAVGGATVPEGTEVTVDGNTYLVTADTAISDVGSSQVPIVSVERGPAYDLTVTDAATIVSPPDGIVAAALVATSIGAASFPERFASQVIGSAMEWTSQVYRGADGRWVADVFTIPDGS